MQVKLRDPSRTRAIAERLRGVFTTRRYTNPRLPLPLPLPAQSRRKHDCANLNAPASPTRTFVLTSTRLYFIPTPFLLFFFYSKSIVLPTKFGEVIRVLHNVGAIILKVGDQGYFLTATMIKSSPLWAPLPLCAPFVFVGPFIFASYIGPFTTIWRALSDLLGPPGREVREWSALICGVPTERLSC